MSLNLKYATIIVLFLHFSCTQKEEKNNLLDMQTLDYAGEENACVFDDNDDFEKAQSLAPTEEGSPLRTTTGYLCPVSDQDWYRFDNQKGILSVSLKEHGLIDENSLISNIGMNGGGVYVKELEKIINPIP